MLDAPEIEHELLFQGGAGTGSFTVPANLGQRISTEEGAVQANSGPLLFISSFQALSRLQLQKILGTFPADHLISFLLHQPFQRYNLLVGKGEKKFVQR